MKAKSPSTPDLGWKGWQETKWGNVTTKLNLHDWFMTRIVLFPYRKSGAINILICKRGGESRCKMVVVTVFLVEAHTWQNTVALIASCECFFGGLLLLSSNYIVVLPTSSLYWQCFQNSCSHVLTQQYWQQCRFFFFRSIICPGIISLLYLTACYLASSVTYILSLDRDLWTVDVTVVNLLSERDSYRFGV